MTRRLAALVALSIAALRAQPSDADYAKLDAQVDQALGVHPGSRVADIGTGLAINQPTRIAKEVGPEGKVTCIEVTPEAVARIQKRIDDEHITNMDAVLGKIDDPLLAPGTFDTILVSNAYHEFIQPEAMLKHICDALKPDGILVVVENYSVEHRKETREQQAKRHEMTPEILERELLASGLLVKEEIDPVLVNSPGRFRYLVRAQKTP